MILKKISMTETAKGVVLDVDYETEENNAVIVVYLKTEKGIIKLKDPDFKPYLSVICSDLGKAKEKIREAVFGEEGIKAISVEETKANNAENVLKVYFRSPAELVNARQEITKIDGVAEKREYDIPFSHRYLLDKGFSPMDLVEVSVEGEQIKKIRIVEGKQENLSIAAFDLETMSREGKFSDAKTDEIITIGYHDKEGSKVFCYAKEAKDIKSAVICKDEKDMIEKFLVEVREKMPDVIVSYNGDSFDFPYLKDRAEKHKIDLNFGFSKPITRKKAIKSAVRLKGMQHVDAYQMVRILARIGAVSTLKFDLETVYEVIFGAHKEKVKAEEIAEIWTSRKDFKRLIDYNREDAEVTYKIAEEFLPLFSEISRLAGRNLYETTRAMSSQLVEAALMKESCKEGYLIPNKPKEQEIKQRMMQSYKGGYVREPLPGLHENIAVLDFRSLHPSIMIAHNVSPETLKCRHEKCKENLSPDKDWFCREKKGFIPRVLEEVLEKRIEIKKQMKKTEKNSRDYKMMNAQQHALKILLNSTYGTLGYARFRWYSRESARAITAWSRHYINETFAKAEKNGFIALYGDTDSAFLIVPKKQGKKEVKEFVEKVNSELPGAMELEFEGLFKRGIFVTKKEGGAAKKKYALIDFDGNLKIVGFEYVRRDWSGVAKNTQKGVLEAVLKEGNAEKAAEIVRKKIKLLKGGKTEKKDLTIMTFLQRPINSYETDAPHVSAAKKAIAKGKKLGVGSLLSYIITKNGKSISDKAELEEYVKEGDYSTDYYIENQLLPAVMKIMAELGYSKEDLITGGKQANLFSFSR